jgi:hypothetical protein
VRVQVIGGVEYVTAAEVVDRWGDVDAGRLRDWCRPTGHRGPLLRPVTVAELAAGAGLPVPDGVDPDGPARVPSGRPGQRTNLYRWSDVVDADAVTRATHRSDRRRGA